jgi:hypothetical protein
MSQPVLDTKVSWTRLLANTQAITYGRRSIALDEAEWVSYWAAHTATKRFLYPTTHHSDYHFEVGRYPYTGPAVAVHDYVPGRRDVVPESWTFLVDLEPRLLDDLVARVDQQYAAVQRHGLGLPVGRPTAGADRAAEPSQRGVDAGAVRRAHVVTATQSRRRIA